MTTKNKAIVSAAIAATLTAVISATALATKPVNAVPDPIAITDSNSVAADEENETTVKKYSSLAETLTPFELAIMMGEAPEHPDGRMYPINRTIDVEDDAALEAVPTMHLERSTITNAYNYWVGNFILNDGQKVETNFTEPTSFECAVSTKEKSAVLSAKYGYLGNYKEIKVSATYLSYDENGKERYEYVVKSDEGNGRLLPIKDNYTGTGKLVEIVYFFSVRCGTESTAPLMDYAVVHFVVKSYSESAAFAAEPYSGLIDQYTIVPDEACE